MKICSRPSEKLKPAGYTVDDVREIVSSSLNFRNFNPDSVEDMLNAMLMTMRNMGQVDDFLVQPIGTSTSCMVGVRTSVSPAFAFFTVLV